MAERDEGATGSQSAMVSGEPVVDIDTVAEAAAALGIDGAAAQ